VTGDDGYGTPAGTVVLSLYPTADCSGPASYATAPQTLTAGSAVGTLSPAAGTYRWRAVYTPTDGINLTSTSGCSNPITVNASAASYVGAGTPVTVAANESDVAIPYPAGTSPGDLVLLVVVNSSTRESNVDEPGWSLIADPQLGSLDMEMTAFWHTAGTETSVLMSRFRARSSGATAWVLAYTNVGTPALAGVSSGTTLSAASVTPAAVTTTAPNTTVISLVGINASRSLSLSTAQGFTARASLTQATPTPGRALGVADRSVAVAGSVTAPTWTEGANPSQWAYITAAFSS
jgi:hypothetical protein